MNQRSRRILVVILCLVCPLLAHATSSYPPPPNIQVTGNIFLQNEEQVCFSPVDSNYIVANYRDFRLGFRQIGVARSSNAGQNWTIGLIPSISQYFSPDAWQSDPTLTVDRFGNFYMTALDFLPDGGEASSTISVYRSTNNGVSWTGPVPAVPPTGFKFEDKQFTAIDRTGGPHDGNFYMAWARFPDFTPNKIIFVRSTDGAQTFDTEIEIGPNQSSTGCGSAVIDAGQFANVMVHADGTVHAFWVGQSLDSGAVCTGEQYLKHRISTDGGASFGDIKLIMPVSGWTQANGGIATYSQPACDADITGGSFNGNMYIAFTNVGDDDAGNSDIDFIRSTDNGTSWSAPLQINDDANSNLIDNFHPWLTVNQEGIIAVIFYDQRLNGPSYFDFDLFAAYSFDGGLTFTTNHRITEVSSSPGNLKSSLPDDDPWEWAAPIGTKDASGMPKATPKAGLLGEYIGVTAFHDKLNAIWTDSRNGNSDIYTANWYLPLLEPRLMWPQHESVTGSQPDFQWATGWKHNADQYRLELSSDPTFASMVQSIVTDTNFAQLSPLPDGIYYWRVKGVATDLGDSSAYSEEWAIEVDGSAPTPLVLEQPLDMAVINDTLPTLDWSTAAKSAVEYDLYLSADPLFVPGPLTFIVTHLTASEYTPTEPLEYDHDYFWYVVAKDQAFNETVSDTSQFHLQESCCVDPTGNVDKDPLEVIDLSDVLYLANAIFLGGPAITCPEEANTDGDIGGVLDLSDILWLANAIFLGGPPTADCQ